MLELEQERNDHAKVLRNAKLYGLDNIEYDEQETCAGGEEESISDPRTSLGL